MSNIILYPDKYDTQISPIDIIDLNFIGINYIINSSKKINYKTIENAVHNIDCSNIFITYNEIDEVDNASGNFTFNNTQYTIYKKIKNGAFGSILDIGNKYILKIIRLRPTLKIDAIKEAIIQHIIFESTKLNNHIDCVYVSPICGVFLW